MNSEERVDAMLCQLYLLIGRKSAYDIYALLEPGDHRRTADRIKTCIEWALAGVDTDVITRACRKGII